MKLRVAHYPQIPCKPFHVEVKDLQEAKKIFDVLANYDQFQLDNRIKPDYCNSTVLEQWDEEEKDWMSWCDDETGIDDLDEYLEHLNQSAGVCGIFPTESQVEILIKRANIAKEHNETAVVDPYMLLNLIGGYNLLKKQYITVPKGQKY